MFKPPQKAGNLVRKVQIFWLVGWAVGSQAVIRIQINKKDLTCRLVTETWGCGPQGEASSG